MRYDTPISSITYPPKASSISHPVFLNTISWWLPTEAAQSSSVRRWYKALNYELSAYDSVFQMADLQQFGLKQKSVRTKVCLENQILVHSVCCQVHASLSHKEEFTVHIRQPHRLFKKQKPVGDAIISKSWRKDNIETIILAVIIKISLTRWYY